jgi:hypothetical protein
MTGLAQTARFAFGRMVLYSVFVFRAPREKQKQKEVKYL